MPNNLLQQSRLVLRLYAPTFDDFPLSTAEPRWEFPGSGKGQFDVAHGKLPATVTTWDQARAILLGLDHLELGRFASA